MSRGYGLRIYTDAAGLNRAVSPMEDLLYIYVDVPLLSTKASWILVRRRPGLDGLVDALRFGLRFAPELLGFKATVVEALEVEEIALLKGLSPSDLGGSLRPVEGRRGGRGEPGGYLRRMSRQYLLLYFKGPPQI
ncbi:MAG: hypothetical protein RXR06_11010 [Thermoproteus sp.]